MSFLDDLFGLAGKTAIVSGGAGVIGTVMSEALLKAGANVVIWSRTRKSVDQAVEKLATSEKLTARLSGNQVDTGSESQVAAALKIAFERFGPPEILINAVGGNLSKAPIRETEIDQFEKVLHLNLSPV